ncbi:MAG: hypothetical protein JW927_04980 [Deltaproteobacteria bacterium]|nr:hypothetical protein [Deltaproteobacteria bacterium]
MKVLLKESIIVFLIFALSSFCMAAELSGTVVKVADLEVTVKIDGQNMPMTGDQMEISFTLPDGESLSIGTWIITQISGNIALGVVKENTGDPVVGHKAVIYSEHPIPTVKVHEAEPQSSFSYTSDRTGVTDDLQQVLQSMRSSNSVQKRDGAKIAYRKFYGDASIAAVAAEELEKGYMINHRDRYHVDAMAWLCNILGASKNKEYRPFLKKVYKNTRSDKISDYAKKNYKLLK